MVEDILTRHPHARAVLLGALLPGGQPSHAYLFHGPAGAGKREAATEFAAALLSAGAADPANAADRVRTGAHPDYTRVAPSGAAGLITEDIERPVIAAATRTPFEATRRVFVIEQADSMNDVASNRMLKTLEEPANFVVLILLTEHPSAMMETIVSRCQSVRFEAASASELRDRLQNSHGIPPATAQACAELALGDGELALRLALGEGESLRAAAQTYTRAVIAGSLSDARAALLLEQASEHERRAKEEVEDRFRTEAEVLGDREKRRHEKEGETAAKRAGRRAKAQTLDDGLRLVSLWLRDVAVAADGEPTLVRNSDRADLIAADSERVRSTNAREAVALVEESRTTLILNPSEPLLLDALASRMERVLNGA
jgi:DNA polymerase-3 subunit delta'